MLPWRGRREEKQGEEGREEEGGEAGGRGEGGGGGGGRGEGGEEEERVTHRDVYFNVAQLRQSR